MRDAETKGGTLESGTSKKEGFHSQSPSDLGMGTSGSKDYNGPQRPQHKPETKAPRGHVIR
jgi:hypothetical protein